MEAKLDNEQVMDPLDESAKVIKKMAPRFIFDGENTGQFTREFPAVADFFGYADVYEWDDDKVLTEAEQRRNTLAMSVLGSYVTEDVYQVITTGRATRASVMLRTLKKIFTPNNARSKHLIERELLACDMKGGESVLNIDLYFIPHSIICSPPLIYIYHKRGKRLRS